MRGLVVRIKNLDNTTRWVGCLPMASFQQNLTRRNCHTRWRLKRPDRRPFLSTLEPSPTHS